MILLFYKKQNKKTTGNNFLFFKSKNQAIDTKQQQQQQKNCSLKNNKNRTRQKVTHTHTHTHDQHKNQTKNKKKQKMKTKRNSKWQRGGSSAGSRPAGSDPVFPQLWTPFKNVYLYILPCYRGKQNKITRQNEKRTNITLAIAVVLFEGDTLCLFFPPFLFRIFHVSHFCISPSINVRVTEWAAVWWWEMVGKFWFHI